MSDSWPAGFVWHVVTFKGLLDAAAAQHSLACGVGGQLCTVYCKITALLIYILNQKFM